MPTNARKWAVDTSVAVATLDATHSSHRLCLAAVRTHRPALSGHAAFETFSVLTRMPGRLATDPPTATALMDRVFPQRLWIDEHQVSKLLERCGAVGIVGGAVYDALVGWAAHANDSVLLTRDLRARRTYDLLGVAYEIVGDH